MDLNVALPLTVTLTVSLLGANATAGGPSTGGGISEGGEHVVIHTAVADEIGIRVEQATPNP